MSDVYPKLYVLENALRSVIHRVLKSAVGDDWWQKCAPPALKKTVDSRKAGESKKPWHGRRGAHEIYYSDFKDLRCIIIGQWPHFREIFGDQHRLSQQLDDLEHPRNIVAHNNPLKKRDLDRLNLHFGDLMDLLKAKRGLIP